MILPLSQQARQTQFERIHARNDRSARVAPHSLSGLQRQQPLLQLGHLETNHQPVVCFTPPLWRITFSKIRFRFASSRWRTSSLSVLIWTLSLNASSNSAIRFSFTLRTSIKSSTSWREFRRWAYASSLATASRSSPMVEFLASISPCNWCRFCTSTHLLSSSIKRSFFFWSFVSIIFISNLFSFMFCSYDSNLHSRSMTCLVFSCNSLRYDFTDSSSCEAFSARYSCSVPWKIT